MILIILFSNLKILILSGKIPQNSNQLVITEKMLATALEGSIR